MLGAFLGTDLREWLLSNAVSLNLYGNYWLVRKSAAKAMSHGFFQFKFGKGSKVGASLFFLELLHPC